MANELISVAAPGLIQFDQRLSDSPYIERVWSSRSEGAGVFRSVADSHFELVVTRLRGQVCVTLRGPETKASLAECPADGEWLGIRFKLGTFMAQLPPGQLRDRQDSTLPDVRGKRFVLDGTAWQYPSYDNAETFVRRLARADVLTRDPLVEAATVGDYPARLQRTVQRRFQRSAGISMAAFRQIERARYAANLLRDGASVLEVVHRAGYYDQAHLTRALSRLIGESPAKIRRAERQLSFLYKTDQA